MKNYIVTDKNLKFNYYTPKFFESLEEATGYCLELFRQDPWVDPEEGPAIFELAKPKTLSIKLVLED